MHSRRVSNLEGLRFLDLSRNYLSCGIPENIGSLKVLESLDLSLNELSGAICWDLGLDHQTENGKQSFGQGGEHKVINYTIVIAL